MDADSVAAVICVGSVLVLLCRTGLEVEEIAQRLLCWWFLLVLLGLEVALRDVLEHDAALLLELVVECGGHDRVSVLDGAYVVGLQELLDDVETLTVVIALGTLPFLPILGANIVSIWKVLHLFVVIDGECCDFGRLVDEVVFVE